MCQKPRPLFLEKHRAGQGPWHTQSTLALWSGACAGAAWTCGIPEHKPSPRNMQNHSCASRGREEAGKGGRLKVKGPCGQRGCGLASGFPARPCLRLEGPLPGDREVGKEGRRGWKQGWLFPRSEAGLGATGRRSEGWNSVSFTGCLQAGTILRGC